MPAISTFYLSRVLGARVYLPDGSLFGRVTDLAAEHGHARPRLCGLRVKTRQGLMLVSFGETRIQKKDGQYRVMLEGHGDWTPDEDRTMFLAGQVLDRQIVDVDGRKLVRVNDLRLATIASGTYLVAVDVGLEGILRRLGIAKPVKYICKPLGLNLPSHLILWDEVEAVDAATSGIRMGKENSSLSRLHPSDLADILEDMDHQTQMAVFSSLNDEQAADVLEELEPDAQVSVLESLSVERAADLLEMMPADEAADILDELHEDKAEALLNEMESEASDEVRELMEYDDDTVGSIMSTEFLSFSPADTVADTLRELRRQKPEIEAISYLYVVDRNGGLLSMVSLRDIIVSEPEVALEDIMTENVIFVRDEDRLESLNEVIGKYNLLAVPVVDENHSLVGMVVVNDVIHLLLRSRKKRI